MELFLKLPVHMVWSSDQVNGKIISVVQFISCLQHLFWFICSETITVVVVKNLDFPHLHTLTTTTSS